MKNTILGLALMAFAGACAPTVHPAVQQEREREAALKRQQQQQQTAPAPASTTTAQPAADGQNRQP
jgi:hypothetical protein